MSLNMTTQMLDIANLHPSPFNRRREWGNIDELAASIKTDGILEPLLVRTRSKGSGYELIAGERRFQAAKVAGLKSVPVIVHKATDGEAMRISAVENLQRENPHPLDEADSYRDLQKDNKANTVPVIAALVGKSPVYIYRRLKLHQLCKKVRESFEQNEITVAHAERLARLDPAQQDEALTSACLYQRTLFEAGGHKRKTYPFEPAPLGELDDWIESRTKVNPASEDAPNYFPEFADAFNEPDALLQLSASTMPGAMLHEKKHGLIGARRWVLVKGKDCKFARKGVIVHGGPLTILNVCISKECGKHRPKGTSGGASAAGAKAIDQKSERARSEAKWRYESAERTWKENRHAAVGISVMNLALANIPTKAVSPTLGKLLLSALPTRELSVSMSTKIALPKGDRGQINLSKLTDEQVMTVIVMSLAKAAMGWYQGYGSDENNYGKIVPFLAALGVKNPKSVITDTWKAYADANPKPEKPKSKKVSVKKTAKKGAK